MKASKLNKVSMDAYPSSIPYKDRVSPQLWRGAMFAISISVVLMFVFIIPWVYGWVRIFKLVF
jgi:hypothetical protein